MPRTYQSVWLHLVWSTKNREYLLTKPIRERLFEELRSISYQKHYKLDCMGGVEDHLHLLLWMKTTTTIAQVVNDLKGLSSHWLNQSGLIEGPFRWQEGYSVYSVSKKDVPFIRKYIANQEQHHQQESYEDELGKL